MNNPPYKKAILHIDGDSFFVSCELTKKPQLRGKPVVTGFERGIATAMSPEAKAIGIKRGTPVHTIKKLYPEVFILESDYKSYSTYSRRMIDIVRRYSDKVEEYSIDECFADLTGLDQELNISYQQIIISIKRDLESELGITFSLGLGPNKVLAKLGSNLNKPSGISIFLSDDYRNTISNLLVREIWGIGPNTSIYLAGLGIKTAGEFMEKSRDFAMSYFSQPIFEIWQELQGEFILPINIEKRSLQQSIMKTRTFSPSSSDKNIIWSELSRNVESACRRLRLDRAFAKEFYFYLKGWDFRHQGYKIKLSPATSSPEAMLKSMKDPFEQIWKAGKLYRATGVILGSLVPAHALNLDIFGETDKSKEMDSLYKNIDKLTYKFKHPVVTLGSSLGYHSQKPRSVVWQRLLPFPLLGRVT